MRIRDQLIYDTRITTMKVYYFMPDYQSVIQLFMWQFDDIPPQFPRAHKFLNHWQHRCSDSRHLFGTFRTSTTSRIQSCR